MKRASYREAIRWIATNDDTEFLNEDGILSVTASLVADMFEVPDEKVREDLKREIARVR